MVLFLVLPVLLVALLVVLVVVEPSVISLHMTLPEQHFTRSTNQKKGLLKECLTAGQLTYRLIGFTNVDASTVGQPIA